MGGDQARVEPISGPAADSADGERRIALQQRGAGAGGSAGEDVGGNAGDGAEPV